MTQAPPPDNAATDPAAAVELLQWEQPVEPERVARISEENIRLRAELRQANSRAQNYEADARRVRASTKYQVGNLLVLAAKNPRRLIVLPRDLLRLYGLRKHRRTVAEETPSEVTRLRRSDLSNEHAARLLLPRMTEAPSAAVALAGAVGTFTAHAWSPYAAVTSVMPHDAGVLVGEVDPDIVILDTAAAAAGEQWSHLGNPAATDRAFAALDLVTVARERGRPVVLVRQSPPGQTAGLAGIAERCDLIVDGPGAARDQVWHPGVALSWWSWAKGPSAPSFDHSIHEAQGLLLTRGIDVSIPAAAHVARTWATTQGTPIVVPRPQAPGIAGLKAGLADASFAIDPHTFSPDIIGDDHALWAALVSGIPVVTQHGADLAEVLGPLADTGSGVVFTYHDARQCDSALTAAAAAGRFPLDVHWQVLRRIAMQRTAPVTLADLANRLHLSIRPQATRDVALVIDDFDAHDTASKHRIVDAVLAQQLLPTALLIPGDFDDRARDALTHAQIAVAQPAPTLSEIAQSMSCNWVAPINAVFAESMPKETLLDLMIMAEITDRTSAFIGDDATLLNRSLAVAGTQATEARRAHAAFPPHPGWTL